MKASQARFIADAEAGSLLHIDLGALVSNWRFMRDRAGDAEASAVVKADAYGTGIETTVPALYRAGCRTFFVAHLSEAVRARTVAPEATIYVLNGLPPGTCEVYREFELRPVLGSLDEFEEWAAFCRAQGQKLKAAVHFDTGMHRLGLTVAQGLNLKNDSRLKDFEPALLMSHFASAEERDNPLNRRQIEAFSAIRQSLPGIPCSLANSSGILREEKPHFELVRPGYALYGGNPTPDQANPMRPVVSLQSRIIQLRTVEEGEGVGYNSRWTARGKRRLATLSIGYADGYPRSASSIGVSGEATTRGMAIVADRLCPFAGTVSMDLIIVDVTDVPENDVKRGDLVTLIGGELTIDEVGRRAGTIGYEILTSLGRRYARTHREAEF
ncbi:alanine racemase [Microvirga terricola]|uniref:Alanine racemase n=1 Tax=Microvirga terricola TaxID=2719797 RepID=A0ABX0VER9_9HYPH|nr:alanine racemase [Microvirga terricola]NIX77661.1 alanine racemase [Microvirga terricola]